MNLALELALHLDFYLMRLLAVFGLIAAGFAATIREDAYRAGDRQSKWTWVAMLAGSAVAMALGMPFIAWIGAVVVGVFWFDVYPQLRDMVRGAH